LLNVCFKRFIDYFSGRCSAVGYFIQMKNIHVPHTGPQVIE